MIVSINPRVSENFYTLKVLSILLVVVGHFIDSYFPLIWVPVTISLLAFSYSSAYFTCLIYGDDFDRRYFWRRKVERLGIRLFVIDVFLLFVFILQGRSGILSWQTVVNLVGFNGFLNWFRISDPSPFGGGMWFFTLLLIFYAVYPLVVRYFRTPLGALISAVSVVLFAFWLHGRVVYGHSLWLTVCGFVLGIWWARHPVRLRVSWLWLCECIVISIGMGLNYIGVKDANFFVILGVFLFGILIWQQVTIPQLVHRFFKPLRGCVLEIYLVHGVVVVHLTSNMWVDLVLSIIAVVFVARMIAYISIRMTHMIFEPASVG